MTPEIIFVVHAVYGIPFSSLKAGLWSVCGSPQDSILKRLRQVLTRTCPWLQGISQQARTVPKQWTEQTGRPGTYWQSL